MQATTTLLAFACFCLIISIVTATTPESFEPLSDGDYGVNAVPAYEVTLTNKGLSTWINTMIEPVLEQIQGLKVPNIKGWKNVFIGNITYELSDITVQHIQVKQFVARVVEDKSYFQLVVEDATADVTLKWHYKDTRFPYSHDSGTATAQLKNMNIEMHTFLSRDSQQRPHIDLKNVVVNIKDLDLKLHGGASWFYDILLSIFKGTVIRSLNDALATSFPPAVQNTLNQRMEKWPCFSDMDDYSSFDQRLTWDSAVKYTKTSMTFGISGQVVDIKSHEPYPVKPHNMDLIQTAQDLQLFFDDSVWESNLAVHYKHGLFSTQLKRQDAPKKLQQLFSTDNWKTRIPGLPAAYPGKEIVFDLKLAAAPKVTVYPAALYVEFPFELTFMVDGHSPVSLGLTAGTAATPFMMEDYNRIALTYKQYNETVTVKHTDVGTVGLVPIKPIMKLMDMELVVPFINSRQDSHQDPFSVMGIFLPLLTDVTFSNKHVSYRDNYIVMSLDMQLEKAH